MPESTLPSSAPSPRPADPDAQTGPALPYGASTLPPPHNADGAADGPAPAVPGYEIVAELGRGGMGVVYQARQTALGRMVALKLIRSAEFATPAELVRFQNEAEAVAR